MTNKRSLGAKHKKKPTIPTGNPAEQAYIRVKPLIDRFKGMPVKRPNMSLYAAAEHVQAALPAILEYREELAALPGFDMTNVDSLDDLALATIFVAGPENREDEARVIEEMVLEGKPLLDRLVAAGHALSYEGLVDGAVLDAVPSGRKQVNLARDLGMVARAIGSEWAEVEGNTALPYEALERAVELGRSLIEMVGIRREGPRLLTKERMATHAALKEAYSEVRAALVFLLRQEPHLINEVVPPLARLPKRAPAAVESETQDDAVENDDGVDSEDGVAATAPTEPEVTKSESSLAPHAASPMSLEPDATEVAEAEAPEVPPEVVESAPKNGAAPGQGAVPVASSC